MAETVDTRVVEARFDSKQFEQGVDKTVKKLDELKKSLNLKDGEKTIAQIGDKISEASDKASNSLETLEKRFTTFFGMLKNKLVGAVADEIVGGIMNIKHSIEGLISSLSTGQISYGMQRYTDILTSVRTLTASGVNQDKAYETIDRLGQYADQTSYSLDQLVSTMSKFKTAGADLDTAQRMVEGLSNAAASMGVNAQEASRAYLNLQQAYSKGKMTQADWISFESLPMVGEKFNQAIIDAAVAVGTLKENGKGAYDVVSKAVKEAGGAGGRVSGAAAKGITAENMGSKLASGWFNKKVMEEVFGGTYYFAEVGVDEVNKYKAKEREIRQNIKDDIANGKLEESQYDKEVTNRLNDYFQGMSKEKIEAKQEEIDRRKETLKLELEAKKNNKKEYDEAKKDYDKAAAELDKEMKEFKANNQLSAFAYEAFRAGQEARSFNDVLNTLKDTISRGWATSFELIFGKLDEAADFFTKLTESQFAEGIYAIGEFRNAVLENWRNAGGRESLLGLLEYMDNIAGSIWKKMGLIVDEEQYMNEHFDQQMYNQILKQDGKEEAEAYKESIRSAAYDQSPFEKIAKEMGQRLMILTRNIQDFFEKVQKWFTEADSTGVSRIQRITNIVESFGTVVGGALQGVGMGLEFLGNIYQSFKTTFDALWKVFDKLANTFASAFDPDQTRDGVNVFTTLGDVFGNIKIVADKLNPVLTKIVEILGEVANFFLEMGVSSVLMNIQFFSDAFGALLEVIFGHSNQKDSDYQKKLSELKKELDSGKISIDEYNKKLEELEKTGGVGVIRKIAEDVKSAAKSISDFFASLFDDLRKLLGIGEDAGTGDGSIFQNIENWFNTNEFVQNAKKWIDKAIADVGDFIKDIPNRISNLGITVGDFFKGIFYEKKTTGIYYGANGRTTTEEWVKKPLTEWLEQAGKDVWKFITKDIPDFIMSIPSIVTEFINSLLYEKKVVNITQGSMQERREYAIATPLKKWLDQAVIYVKAFIKSIPEKIKKIPSIIGEFFKKLLYTPTTVSGVGTVWVKKPFTKWFDEHVVKALKEFIGNLPTYIGQAIGTVGDLIGKIFSTLFGQNQDPQAATNTVQDALEQPLLGIDLTNILNTIKEIGKKVVNGVLSIFTGQTDWESNKNWLAEGVGKLIDNIRSKAEEVWDKVRDFFADLPNKITNFFSGSADKTKEGGQIWTEAQKVVDGIKNWLSTVPGFLLNAWKSVEATASGLWSKIVEWVTGGSSDKEETQLKGKFRERFNYLTSIADQTPEAVENIKSDLLKQQWRENNPAAANIEDFFVQLGDYLKEKLEGFPDTIAAAWESFMTWVQTIPDKVAAWFDEDADRVNATDEDGISFAISRFVNNIGVWISGIPNDLLDIWETAEKTSSSLFDAVINWITGDDSGNKLNDKYQNRLNNFLNSNKLASKEDIDAYKESLFHEQWREDNPVLANIEDFFKHLIKYFKEKLEKLPENISNAWTTAKQIGAKIGPKLLEALQSGITWVNERVTGLTEKLTKIHSEDPNATFADTLKKNITFTDEDGKEVENPIWTTIKNIGQSLKEFITETIPKFISSAFEEIKRDIPKLVQKIFGGNGDSISEEVTDQLIKFDNEDPTGKKAQKLEQRVLKNAKKNDSLLESILGWFVSPAVAEEVDEANANSEKDKTSIETLKKNIKDKLGSYGGIVDIIAGAGNVFGSFLSSDIGKYVLLGLVVSSILSTIADILSLGDEIEAAKDKAKWDAIKVAILGLVALTGYFLYLAATDTGKLETAKQALNDIADALQKMLLPIEIIMGIMAGGKAFDTIGKFFEWRTAKAESKNNNDTLDGDETLNAKQKFWLDRGAHLLDTVEDTLLGPAQQLLSMGATALGGEWLGEMFEMISGNVNDAMGQFGSGMEVLSSNIVDVVNNLNSVSNNLTTAIDTLGPIKTLIVDMVGLMSTTFEKDVIEDGEVVKKTTNVMSEIGTVNRAFIDLSGSLSLFKNSVSGYGKDATDVAAALEKILGSKGSMKEFAEFIKDNSGDWEIFKKALTSLGSIFHLYSASLGDTFEEVPKEVNITHAVEFLTKLYDNEEFKTLMQTFSKKALPVINQKNVDNAENIVIFAAAISSIAQACSGIKSNATTNINTLLEVIRGVKLGKNDDDIASISQKFGVLGNALGSFAFNTAGLTKENLENAERALRMLTTISIELGKTPDDSWFSKWISGDKSIDTFSQRISETGQNLNAFFVAIDAFDATGNAKSINLEKLNAAFSVLDVFTRAAQRMNEKHFDDKTVGNFTSFLGALTSELLTTFGQNINAFLKEISKINEEGNRDFNDDDFTYINTVLTFIDRLSVIIKRFDSLKLENFNALPDTDAVNNPLRRYFVRLFKGMGSLGDTLKDSKDGLAYVEEHINALTMYTNLVSEIIKILTFSRRATNISLASEEAVDKITNIVDALFGWTDKDTNFHQGVFEKVLDFLNATKQYEESAEELSPESKSKDIFMGVSDIISSFSRAISDIAKADAVAGMHGFVASEYSSYVTKLAGALQAILDNEDTFINFFNFGGKFNSANVTNMALIAQTLNALVQMLATLKEIGYGEFNFSDLSATFDWPTLFDTITDLIMGDNHDFFQPKISPVFDLDTLKEQVPEFHKLLGVTMGEDGKLKMDVSMNITEGLQFPETHNYTEQLESLIHGVTEISTNTNSFSRDLRSVQFTIDGIRLVDKLGPVIDQWLGKEAVCVVRATVN